MPLQGPPLDDPVPIRDILKIRLSEKPNEIALVSLDTRWTWRVLDEASTRLAAHYIGIGLRPATGWHR